jgi:hypothetical protein
MNNPTIADKVRSMPDPYACAIAKMEYRDAPFGEDKVIFYFADGSTLTFKKVYKLED